MKKQKSFTLIELLVVIAIIGLLSSVVLVSMQGIRDKARIARGLEFSQSIQHALGAYTLGWWSFETIQAGKVIDGSGHGNDCTVSGATLIAGMDGLDNALSFDGNDYISNTTLNLNGAACMTIEVWIKPNTLSGSQMIAQKNGPFFFGLTGAKIGNSGFVLLAGGSWGGLVGNTDLKVGIWQHVAMTYDGAKLKFYLNGAQDGIVSRTGALSGNGALIIGASSSGGLPPTSNWFNGLIDEVRIYEQGITAGEIQRHYVEGLKKHSAVE